MMNECTFVVQGPILPNTKECLDSIRKHYPASTIILSTWDTEDTSSLTYDTLVLNTDPGAYEWKCKTYNNTNRQIVSTLSGLEAVKSTYAVKTRTDIEITNNNLQTLLESSKLDHQKIGALNLFFRDPLKYPTLFHIGDIFQFGHIKNLIDLWDIPLQPEPEISTWCRDNVFPLNQWKGFLPRYTPEQYIYISYLQKKGVDVQLKYCNQMTPRLAIISEIRIAEKFLIFTRQQLGINIPDHFNEEDVTQYLYTQDHLNMISTETAGGRELTKFINSRNRSILIDFLTSPRDIILYALSLTRKLTSRLTKPSNYSSEP